MCLFSQHHQTLCAADLNARSISSAFRLEHRQNLPQGIIPLQAEEHSAGLRTISKTYDKGFKIVP
jgi:hypothetical protein